MGYRVRSDAEGEFLVNRFPEYKGKVEYALVPDIETVCVLLPYAERTRI